MLHWKALQSLLFISAAIVVLAQEPKPDQVYDGGLPNNKNSPIQLRIGNGGAGQSGLIKVLADAFIKDSVNKGAKPFRAAWYRSDTTVSINYLAAGTCDVAITYSPAAEQIAIQQGIAKNPSYYAFRDHFYIVGPKSNPAGLTPEMDVLRQFSQLHHEAEKGNSTPPVRFLSRFDKSATNIKESVLFLSIGQVPWATAVSTWYHLYIAFPIQALNAAIILQEYTLTDRGTWLSLPTNVTEQAVIYKKGGDTDPADLLLNPAHLLISTKAKNPVFAQKFADWLVGDGQSVIAGFKKNGQQLYTPAPA